MSRDKGELENAKGILADRVEKAKGRSPVNYLSLVQALAPLSLTLLDLKQFQDAKERAQECLDIRQSKLPMAGKFFTCTHFWELRSSASTISPMPKHI